MLGLTASGCRSGCPQCVLSCIDVEWCRALFCKTESVRSVFRVAALRAELVIILALSLNVSSWTILWNQCWFPPLSSSRVLRDSPAVRGCAWSFPWKNTVGASELWWRAGLENSSGVRLVASILGKNGWQEMRQAAVAYSWITWGFPQVG